MGLTVKKALIVTNAASMIHLFNEINIELLQEEGYEVHIACNFHSGNTTPEKAVMDYKAQWDKKGIISHEIGYLRTPFSLKSLKNYKDTKKLIQSDKFDIIHCHTPIVSVFVRLAARKARKLGAKVIYTAHGFHFHTGCPFPFWLTYYPIEKLLAPLTDILITINKEDYERALRKFKTKEIIHINGVGIDVNKICSTVIDRHEIRQKFGIPDDCVMLTSIGELSNRKNHVTAIKALAQCSDKTMHYAIAGIGYNRDKLIELSKELGVADRVHLIGFQNNVYELLKASDIFVFPSYREGLPVALMEAMAAGVPVVASRIRGNVDLIDEGDGGYLFEPADVDGFAHGIEMLVSDKHMRERMSEYNNTKIQIFDRSVVIDKLMDILMEILQEKRKKNEVKAVEV